MKKTQTRLKLVFIPFLAIAILFLLGYTFLNWLFLIKFPVFTLNEEVTNLWGPIVLCWIPVLLWLRPRIKLLNLKRKKGDLPGLYFFIAAFAIAIPTIVAQSWLETASGKLTRLADIDHITKSEATKYYTVDKFYIDRLHQGVKTKFSVSGKNNEHFDMNLYIVLPMLSSPDDTAHASCLAWYGVHYHRTISNRLTKEAKEQEYEAFWKESQADFDAKDLRRFIYLDRVGNTDDQKGWLAAIKKNPTYHQAATTVLVPVNEPFEKRNGQKFAWTFGALAIGAALWLIMVLIPKLDETAVKNLGRKDPRNSEDAKWAAGFFIPREGFFITPIIAWLNILIFIIMVLAGLGVLSFDSSDLLSWGANYRPAVSHGEWWRLLTSMFLHGGLMHLVSNMYGLILVGLFLEPALGKIKFALTYLVTGLLAGFTSLWWHPATISVGASGAIFGLYGTFLVLILTNVYPKDFGRFFLPLVLIFIGYNILMGLTGGIDNAAHLGGLLSGMGIGWYLSTSIVVDPKQIKP